MKSNEKLSSDKRKRDLTKILPANPGGESVLGEMLTTKEKLPIIQAELF